MNVLYLGAGAEYLRKYVAEARSIPRVGEYVDMGDNVRRYVTEVVHDLDPENVAVRCYLKAGHAP